MSDIAHETRAGAARRGTWPRGSINSCAAFFSAARRTVAVWCGNATRVEREPAKGSSTSWPGLVKVSILRFQDVMDFLERARAAPLALRRREPGKKASAGRRERVREESSPEGRRR